MDLIGSKVKHAKFGVGVVSQIEDEFVSVDFNGVVKEFQLQSFTQFFTFENEDVYEFVSNLIQTEKEKKDQEQKDEESKRIKMPEGVRVVDSERNVTVRLGCSSHIDLRAISDANKQRIQAIFDECDKTALQLYDDFNPKMEYPKITSRARSKYVVGFLCNHLNTYVLRVFSRNDDYKKGVRSGVTVLKSDTTEIMRVLYVNGVTYYFTKNISTVGGRVNNTTKNNFWKKSYDDVILNEVVKTCDCGYLNDYIEERNVSARQYGKLALCALCDNKAEIVFKHRNYAAAYLINGLSEYLSEFSLKQIDFACKNDVIHALPIIKKHGIYDLDVLKKMELIMQKRWSHSVYEILLDTFKKLCLPISQMDQRLIAFVKCVKNFDVRVYCRYILRLPQNTQEVTVSDLFDEDYEEIYNAMMKRGYDYYSSIDEINYERVANELSWIDREDNGYFIRIPKTIEEFRQEGISQHICVYNAGFFYDVIDHKSIIVFLRK